MNNKYVWLAGGVLLGMFVAPMLLAKLRPAGGAAA